MSENLSNFLVDLASDPARMAAFAANPIRELEGSTLTVDEKAALIARDAARLRHALGAAAAAVPMAKIAPSKKKGGRKKGGKKKSGSKKKK